MIRRYLVICAHPDDADIRFGGTAVKLVRAGHLVKFVSVGNGDCGHFSMSGPALALRRRQEADAARAVAGIREYQILDHHDCELEATLPVRREILKIIREFQPDVVLTHRACDYHADHRAVATLVQDASYLAGVPMYMPEVPVPGIQAVYGYLYDTFTDPRPLRPDAVVPFDDVVEEKCRILDCHVSQFYEWLAWERKWKDFDHEKLSWEEKVQYLMEHWGKRFRTAADSARERLCHIYGPAGNQVRHAELFEMSPYGKQVSPEEFQGLFRFD